MVGDSAMNTGNLDGPDLLSGAGSLGAYSPQGSPNRVAASKPR